MKRVIYLLLPVLLVSACTTTRVESRLFVAARDLDALARASDVIVVGRVLGEGAVRNIARDPNDLTREHPTVKVLAQEYRVLVESPLKGAVSGTITVTVARWDQFAGRDPVPSEGFLPLDQGATYALFLRRHAHDPNLFAVAFEPSRFKLGTSAVVQSPWTEATQVFPARSSADFLTAVRAAIVRSGLSR